MSNNKKIIIIGSGLTGATIARQLAESGFKIEIYEKRNHIGGNVFDTKKNNVLVHQYGPHIFHTSNEKVNNFMNQFWILNSFKNIVEGYVDNKLVPIPFNFKSIDICFPNETEEIKNKLLNLYPDRRNVPILELKEAKDEQINKLANFIYDNLFLNYTTKMWNLKPDEIDQSVTARIPVILSYNNTYFNDKYEGLPKEGYTKTIEKILDHKNIKIFLNANPIQNIKEQKNKLFFNDKDYLIIYTGAIDQLFNYKFGLLDYRSLFFEFETINKTKFQDTAVVNYPDDPKMTRITEYKNMTLQKVDNITVISKEYPGTYKIEDSKWNEPYYPLATNQAREKYNKYFEYAKQFNNLKLCGRLALYKYINMDQAIAEALDLADQIIKEYN